MSDKQNSYRQIVGSTSIFGGVKVITIVIMIIRSKVVAILLGPLGMGINSLLSTSQTLVASLTNFGLRTSAVKSVAAAAKGGDLVKAAVTVKILRRLVWVTGLAGTILMAVSASFLSEITFGNKDYTMAFVWISVTMLFRQISDGQLVVLQGLRKIKYLASASLAGSFYGLLISIPLYYWYGIDGIVPAIILSSIASVAISWYYARKVDIPDTTVDLKETFGQGKEMLKLGFFISMNGLLTTGFSYLLRIFISNTGGVEQVGLYGAGFAIVHNYVSMIFAAMGTDYYPRLSAVAEKASEARVLMNEQAEVAILLVAPLLVVLIVFIRYFILILYSSEFLEITTMVHWAALGIFFKAASFPVAYIFLAKSAGKTFFWNELCFNVLLFALNVLGYMYGGLAGLGISFIVSYIIYLLQVTILTNYFYGFFFKKKFILFMGLQTGLGVSAFLLVNTTDGFFMYIVGIVLITISALFSLYHLNKMLDIRSLFLRK